MSFVRLEHEGETAILVLARPPANAIDLGVTAELDAALAELEAAPPKGGVVLTGEGKVFSGGVDFKAVPGYSTADKQAMVSNINSMVTRLYGLPTATVAAVNGHAIGGGFVLALACDARLAVESAKLGLTEVTAGIPYPACPMEVVKAEIEPSLRRTLVLGGAPASAGDMTKAGLLDALVVPDELHARAIELAATRAAFASYAAVKKQLKADALAAMRRIISEKSDPTLREWV